VEILDWRINRLFTVQNPGTVPPGSVSSLLLFGIPAGCFAPDCQDHRRHNQTKETTACGCLDDHRLGRKQPNMMIIGVDYHPSFQAIAFFVEESGECGEQELKDSDGQAERFYRDLKQRGVSVWVGLEATGYARSFERLLAELGFELWIGDPAEIRDARYLALKLKSPH
jgi:hypothetical protein